MNDNRKRESRKTIVKEVAKHNNQNAKQQNQKQSKRKNIKGLRFGTKEACVFRQQLMAIKGASDTCNLTVTHVKT